MDDVNMDSCHGLPSPRLPDLVTLSSAATNPIASDTDNQPRPPSTTDRQSSDHGHTWHKHSLPTVTASDASLTDSPGPAILPTSSPASTVTYQQQRLNQTKPSGRDPISSSISLSSSPQPHLQPLDSFSRTIIPSSDPTFVPMMAEQHHPQSHLGPPLPPPPPDGSSGFQSAGSLVDSSWPPATPSSSSSNVTFGDYPPTQSHPVNPQPPPYPYATAMASPPICTPPNSHHHQHQLQHGQEWMSCTPPQPPQLPEVPLLPSDVVGEFEKIMNNENDKIVLANSICLLFRFSIDDERCHEICQAMSQAPNILGRLYYVLLDNEFRDDDLILCYATGNLTNISKYDLGRWAILGRHDPHTEKPSLGVRSLISSLQSRDCNTVIFAITAIHNLLLDPRTQEDAKEQIKFGLEHLIRLLDNQMLKNSYEFKVIVLDCLQILAHGQPANRLAIKLHKGPALILRTMQENLDRPQSNDELIATASRVLKRLSLCHENKLDIINNDGVQVLTSCINSRSREILKNCLWTLRNLSDVINVYVNDSQCVNALATRLLDILCDFAENECIITCALGTLANLTCNNESVKKFICQQKGVDLLLEAIARCPRNGLNFQSSDNEIIEPAVLTLSHLMNQGPNSELALDAKLRVKNSFDIFRRIENSDKIITGELDKALRELARRAFDS